MFIGAWNNFAIYRNTVMHDIVSENKSIIDMRGQETKEAHTCNYCVPKRKRFLKWTFMLFYVTFMSLVTKLQTNLFWLEVLPYISINFNIKYCSFQRYWIIILEWIILKYEYAVVSGDKQIVTALIFMVQWGFMIVMNTIQPKQIKEMKNNGHSYSRKC